MALPAIPTITSVTVSGLVITVSITGDAAGSYRVRLMNGAGTEEDEDSLVGSGDIALTALGYGLRYISAWGVDGINQTEPVNVYVVDVPDPSAEDVEQYRVIEIVQVPGSPFKQLTLERIERPVTVD